jgi:hypothetical protein
MHLRSPPPPGKLLGYIITERSIEANPDKILTITKMRSVKNVRDVQRLMGCLTTLNQFMYQLGEHVLPLYKQLKKSDSFRWMEEMQEALDDLKTLIIKLPVLASPEPGKILLFYVAVTTQVVSAALLVEREKSEHI